MKHYHRILSLLLISLSLGIATEAGARSEYWEQRASLFRMLPIRSTDIVFLGNSITDGGEFVELLGNPNVRNRGISGDVIPGVMERLAPVVEGRPTKIFLLIGINDISQNFSADTLAAKYENLVKEIRTASPDTKLYLQSVMPINMDYKRFFKTLGGKEEVVSDLNARIKSIAENYGVTYIDLWEVLADPQTGKLKDEFTNDGLHLLGEGYAAWMEKIRPFVEE